MATKSLEVRISNKSQIVIPKLLREKLNFTAGDYLIMELKNNKLIVRPRPKNYTNYMLGLGENLWKKENAKKYIKEERKTWER